MKILTLFMSIFLSFIFISCGSNDTKKSKKELEEKMNAVAENYVKLILKIGQHDPDYVDAYYGPDDLKPSGEAVSGDSTAIQNLYDETNSILDSLDVLSDYQSEDILTLRYRYLYKQLMAAQTRLFMLAGGKLSFDDEVKKLYDAEAPNYSDSHFQDIIDQLDKILPGKGDVSARINEFKKGFIIPSEKLDTVFQAAIAECRKRTLNHIQLPSNENFTIQYVTDKPYGGYNWFKGNSYSVIEINTDLPIYIDKAVDLGSHEGYPGHHVYNLLLEKELYKNRGWVEFSVYALFSPQSLIAEGSANFGVAVAFPGDARVKFEREVLFPLAGLDESKADDFYKVLDLQAKLSYAGNEAARNYLNGDWTKEETISWLIKYALATKESAEKNIAFYEKYRSYVVNYNLGEDIVKDYVERNGGTAENPDKRWQIFERILSTPLTPSGLKN